MITNVYAKEKEYSDIIEKMLITKLRELIYKANVIENIPELQIAPVEYIEKQETLYELDFAATLSVNGTSRCSSIYMFSKDLLEKVIESMKSVTANIQEELRLYLNQLTFEHHSKEEIESFIKCYGYSNMTITKKSDHIKYIYYNRCVPKIEIKREYDCECCRDGGCPSCEPHRFITGLTYM